MHQLCEHDSGYRHRQLYKDAVLSPFEPVSNCSTLKVIKATDPTGRTGPQGGFAYTLSRVGGEQVKFDGTTSISDTLSGHGVPTPSPRS